MGDNGDDDRTGFESLTARERECLRLVARHHQSKEIARLLNISKSTVDKHIDRARERLGAADRRAAALALATHEMSMGIGYPSDPAPISPAADIGSAGVLFEGAAGRDDEADDNGRRGTDQRRPGVPGQLDGPGIGAEPAGQPGQGGQHPDGGLGAAQDAGIGGAGQAAAADPQRHGLADLGRVLPASRGGVHDLTPLRLLALVAAVAILGSLLLGGVLMGAHEVALLVQRIIDGIWPRGG